MSRCSGSTEYHTVAVSVHQQWNLEKVKLRLGGCYACNAILVLLAMDDLISRRNTFVEKLLSALGLSNFWDTQ